MEIQIFSDTAALARAAANQAATLIRSAIEQTGKARVIAAAAASQIEFLATLVICEGIDWKRVELFQLDEYIGLPATHPASFHRFLQTHLVIPTGLTTFHSLSDIDTVDASLDAGRALSEYPADVALVGIGENGHLAFNDPPADFEIEEPYIVVQLDEACRQQQVDEGWFASLAEVPVRAISMSVRQILKARAIVTVVPDLRKARAVQACFKGEIRPEAPASALRGHPNVAVYLDSHSASLL